MKVFWCPAMPCRAQTCPARVVPCCPLSQLYSSSAAATGDATMRRGQARPHCHRLRSCAATWGWEVFLSPVPWGASHGQKSSSTDADADARRGCARCSAAGSSSKSAARSGWAGPARTWTQIFFFLETMQDSSLLRLYSLKCRCSCRICVRYKYICMLTNYQSKYVSLTFQKKKLCLEVLDGAMSQSKCEHEQEQCWRK